MTYYGDDCFPADTHPTPFQFVIVYTLTLQCFPACAPYSTLHPSVMPTPSPLSSLPTLTHSSAFPSQSCRSVSVWSQEGRRRLRQCWSTTLTRSSSLAALLWATLSCRQQPSTSLQSSYIFQYASLNLIQRTFIYLYTYLRIIIFYMHEYRTMHTSSLCTYVYMQLKKAVEH